MSLKKTDRTDRKEGMKEGRRQGGRGRREKVI